MVMLDVTLSLSKGQAREATRQQLSSQQVINERSDYAANAVH